MNMRMVVKTLPFLMGKRITIFISAGVHLKQIPLYKLINMVILLLQLN